MKAKSLGVVGALCLAAAVPTGALAQAAPYSAPSLSPFATTGPGDRSGRGQVVTPDSSIARPGDAGRRVHTHYKIFVPAGTNHPVPQLRRNVTGGPPLAGYYYNTPASLACIYGLVPATPGCNPETLTSSSNPSGGSRVVAIVDAYNNPSAMADLQVYSTQFGLPPITATNFQVVYATTTGSAPPNNTGWAGEIALDVEMAHALAPNAKIILVEAASASTANLNIAVQRATSLVAAAGGGEVSMSYGSSEYSTETSYEPVFNGTNNVVYFASTGDDPGTEWPSVSPNVVAAGGTATSRRNDQRFPSQFGFFRTEVAWAEGGGGVSQYFPIPSYQSATIASRLQSNKRGVPDLSFEAAAETGVWVYCSSGCGNAASDAWFGLGGTSVASPALAALVNNAGQFRASSAAQLAAMYSQLGTANFFDVNYGVCGVFAGYGGTAGAGAGDPAGWDFCTGLGSPRGLGGL